MKIKFKMSLGQYQSACVFNLHNSIFRLKYILLISPLNKAKFRLTNFGKWFLIFHVTAYASPMGDDMKLSNQLTDKCLATPPMAFNVHQQTLWNQSAGDDVSQVPPSLKIYIYIYTEHQCTAWATYQIRKISGCACAGNAGNVFPATDFNGNRYLEIPACITTRASRTCRDVCRDR